MKRWPVPLQARPFGLVLTLLLLHAPVAHAAKDALADASAAVNAAAAGAQPAAPLPPLSSSSADSSVAGGLALPPPLPATFSQPAGAGPDLQAAPLPPMSLSMPADRPVPAAVSLRGSVSELPSGPASSASPPSPPSMELALPGGAGPLVTGGGHEGPAQPISLAGGKAATAQESEEDDADRSAEEALSYIKGRLSKARREGTMWRKRLQEALTWGHSLQQQLAETSRAAAAEKRKMHQLVARQAKEVATVLAAERRHERFLEQSLRNATHALNLRGQTLARTRQQLQSFGIAEKGWRAEEEKMRHDKTVDEAEISARDATLRWLRAAKSQEEAELNATRAERAREAQLAHDQVAEAQAREQHWHELFAKEHHDAAARDKIMREQLMLRKRQYDEERNKERSLRQRIGEIQEMSARELTNLTAQLRDAMKRQENALKEREALAAVLRGNVSEIAHLNNQVSLLRRQLADGDSARARAEASAKKAEEEMAAAQAVAKQLSGTVPQLLEQAQLAHEARDAEKAMRAQVQAAAKQQIEHLEQQYTSVVQGQIDQLAYAAPRAAAGPGGGNDTSLIAQDEEVPADMELDSSTDAGLDDQHDDAPNKKASAQASASGASTQDQDQDAEKPDDAEKAPDLANDSNGLGQLLTQDPSADQDQAQAQAAPAGPPDDGDADGGDDHLKRGADGDKSAS